MLFFKQKKENNNVWIDLANFVNENWTDENAYIQHYNFEGISLAEAIEKFLSKRKEVVKYAVENIDVYDDCSFDTGVVYAAWVQTDGSLQNIDFTWMVC